MGGNNTTFDKPQDQPDGGSAFQKEDGGSAGMKQDEGDHIDLSREDKPQG
jgi:hypothetical protein